METTKQTQPASFPLRWIFGVIGAFLLIGLWVINIGNAEGKYTPKFPAAEAQLEKLIRNTWCPMKKGASADKLEDDNHGVKYKDINRNLTAMYRDMNCKTAKINITVEFDAEPEKVSFIPTAKALSFEDPNELEKKSIGTWKITRYYTPVKGQKRYFIGNFSRDFRINCSGDCLVTANGYRLAEQDEYKAVACPPSLKFGTRLHIDGIGEVVCQDRGGAIKGKRLDVWAGIGDRGLDNIYARPETSGYHQVFLII